jgi:hypothetical protein
MSDFSIKWLKAWSLLTAAIGLMFAVYDLPVLGKPAQWFTDAVFLRPLGSALSATPDVALPNALLGAITLGWGLFMWAVIEPLAKHDAAALRRAFVLAFTVWFAFDQWGSLRAGAYGNMLSNTLFYGAFIFPFLMQRNGRIATTWSGRIPQP